MKKRRFIGIDVTIQRCYEKVRLEGEGTVRCMLQLEHKTPHFTWLKEGDGFRWEDRKPS